MNETITAGLCSSAAMRAMASDAVAPYLLLQLDSRCSVEVTPQALDRMARVAEDSGAVMVYADFHTAGDDGTIELCRVNDWQKGAVRDDFDFGPVALVRTEEFRRCVDLLSDYDYAGWYAVRLALSRCGNIVHIPEPLSLVTRTADAGCQFDYVNPRNREVQVEMEKAFTCHLREIGALLEPPFEQADLGGDYPVEASVVIPVRNRARTIADAVNSALSQEVDFDFNVIVVDNHSTDGTGEILREMAEADPRLIVITPASRTLGIGGCWNEAIMSDRCGRFAIQLDSDDIYAYRDVVSRIVEKFRQERPAMVIGSYRLTDFNLEPLPPGVIDHREWTDSNGPNNALRINGLGAPRAFFTGIARRLRFPDVSYGEDYAMALGISRRYRISRIFDVLYICRRWEGNSDASLSREKAACFNHYKDTLRTWEITARQHLSDNTDE